MHDIAVLNDIILAFRRQLASSTALRFAAKLDEIGVLDNFRPYKAALKIGMDNSGALGCFHAFAEGPSTHFIASGGEERT